MSSIKTIKADFSTLTDIEDVENISSKDEQILEDLKAVILRHNKQDRFGITLLHKHFEVGENEKAVESYDPHTRTSKIHVVVDSDGKQEMVESVWRFSKEEAA